MSEKISKLKLADWVRPKNLNIYEREALDETILAKVIYIENDKIFVANRFGLATPLTEDKFDIVTPHDDLKEFEVSVTFDGSVVVRADNEETAENMVASMNDAELAEKASGTWDINGVMNHS